MSTRRSSSPTSGVRLLVSALLAAPLSLAGIFAGVFVSGAGCGGADAPVSAVASALDAAPVQLRYAQAKNRGCTSCVDWSGVIDVADLAYDKQVTVVASDPSGPGWHEIAARYAGPASSGRQLWTFEGVGSLGTTRFAVRYRVAGAEYWDNNLGADYTALSDMYPGAGFVGIVSPLGTGTDIALSHLEAYLPARGRPGHTLYARLLVRNRAVDKDVALVYSTDDWKTVGTVPATYAYGSDVGGETWTVNLLFPETASQIRFAAVVHQAGGEAWDNNDGRNYQCSIEGGSWQCRDVLAP